MKPFNMVPKIKWDEPFWVNEFPNIRIERLIEILNEFSAENTVSPDRLKDIFFTPLPNQESTGIGIIFHRMDHGFNDKKMGYIDPLMRTVYSTLIKPHYHPTNNPNILRNILDLILQRNITTELQVELVTDIWKQFVVPTADDQERIDMADVFLSAIITSKKQASNLLAQLIQSLPTFLDFLLSSSITDITRFEKCIVLFNAIDMHIIIKLVDANVLKKMILIAELDSERPIILQQAIRLTHHSVYDLWKAAVDPLISTEPDVANAFLNVLFAEPRPADNNYFCKILAHAIQHSPSFKKCLLASNHLGSDTIQIICNLNLSTDETITIITALLNNLRNTDQSKALELVKQLPAMSIHYPVLLDKLWELVEAIDDLTLASEFIKGLLNVPHVGALHRFITHYITKSGYFEQSFVNCNHFEIK